MAPREALPKTQWCSVSGNMLGKSPNCYMFVHRNENKRGWIPSYGHRSKRIIHHHRASGTYLFSNNMLPVVVQYWFHFQAFLKGGFIQTIIQTNVDWRQFISKFCFILGKIITNWRMALWNSCKMLAWERHLTLVNDSEWWSNYHHSRLKHTVVVASLMNICSEMNHLELWLHWNICC